MITTTNINYKGTDINYDDFGCWTVFYEGDDLVFNTVEEAKRFIDEEERRD